MDRSEKIKTIFKTAETEQKAIEAQFKLELAKPSNPLHVSFNLFNKGTIKDKMESAKELVLANKQGSIFIIKDLIGFLSDRLDKKTILYIEGIKSMLIGPYKEDMPHLKNFKDYLDEDKALVNKSSSYDETDNQTLVKYYVWSMIRIYITSFITKIDGLVKQTNNVHLKQLIDNIIELVNRSADWIVPPLTRSLLYDLGSASNQLINSIEKIITLAINNRSSISLQLAKIVNEKLNAPNTSVDLRRNLLSILVSIKFEAIEDKNVNYFVLEVLLAQLSAFLQLFKDKKAAKKALMTEKRATVSAKKIRRKRYNLIELITERIAVYSKLLSQCVRGLNKILPSIKGRKQFDDFLDSHLKLFFNFCRLSSSKVSIQLLIFMFQVVKYDMYSKIAERYANLLYDLINSAEIFESKLCEQVFDLLLNFVKNDHSSERILAFIKRLFNTVIHCDSKIVITALIFYAKIAQHKVILQNLIHNKTKLAMDNNGEEAYKDVEESEEEEIRPAERALIKEREKAKESEVVPITGYDSGKRNPLYANSQESFLWELLLLRNHYNPVVRKLVSVILNLKFEDIDYKGNPLNDFSYSAVFRRFAIKGVKQKTQNKKLQNERFKVSGITYENYKDVLQEDEEALKLYFENKVNQLAEVRKTKRNRKANLGDAEDEDEFADALFEKEMVKMNGGTIDADAKLHDDDFDENVDEDMDDDGMDDFSGDEDFNDDGEFGDDDEELSGGDGDFADVEDDYVEPLRKKGNKNVASMKKTAKKVKSN